jgi:lipid-binding SYLF domain-containing protein
MKKTIGIFLLTLCSLIAAPAMAWDANAATDAEATAAAFKAEDPDLDAFFEKAAGYAVFPSVGKAAIGIGGARGKGVVFAGGEAIGNTTLTQLSIGVSLGGQTYSEIVFFEKDADLDAFKAGKFALDASASAVVLKKGASKTTNYSKGVAVFTKPKGGLMFEAGVGGQNFSYTAK